MAPTRAFSSSLVELALVRQHETTPRLCTVGRGHWWLKVSLCSALPKGLLSLPLVFCCYLCLLSGACLAFCFSHPPPAVPRALSVLAVQQSRCPGPLRSTAVVCTTVCMARPPSLPLRRLRCTTRQVFCLCAAGCASSRLCG